MTTPLHTTGIGSLPFNSFEEAVSHSLNNYSIPWLPEILDSESKLPNNVPHFFWRICPPTLKDLLKSNDHLEIQNYLEGPLTIDQSFEEEPLSGLTLFKEELKKTEVNLIKIQYIGPQTFSKILIKSWSIDNELAVEYSHKLTTYIGKLIIRKLRRYKLILVWDEPMMDDISEFTKFNEKYKSEVHCIGLHCCAPFASKFVPPAGSKSYLSFDTSVTDLKNEILTQRLQNHLISGGTVALGIVNTAADKFAFTNEIQINKSIETLREFGQIILTPGCGTGLKSTNFETQTAIFLNKHSKSV